MTYCWAWTPIVEGQVILPGLSVWSANVLAAAVLAAVAGVPAVLVAGVQRQIQSTSRFQFQHRYYRDTVGAAL